MTGRWTARQRSGTTWGTGGFIPVGQEIAMTRDMLLEKARSPGFEFNGTGRLVHYCPRPSTLRSASTKAKWSKESSKVLSFARIQGETRITPNLLMARRLETGSQGEVVLRKSAWLR